MSSSQFRYRLGWLCLLFIFNAPLPARSLPDVDHLQETLIRVPVSEIWSEAERAVGSGSDFPVARVYRGQTHIGYVFLNSGLVDATGYSGKPIHVLIAIDKAGVIQGLRLTEHHEPIVLIGIPESRITALLDTYIGVDVAAMLRSNAMPQSVDIVSGATVTVMVMDDSIINAAIKVVRRFGLGGVVAQANEKQLPARQLRDEQAQTTDWNALLENGSIGRLHLTIGDVNRAFLHSGNSVAANVPQPGNPADTFIDLHAALVSVPDIGKSLLGRNEFRNLEKRLKSGQHAILVMGSGSFSFKGSGYVRGGIFDRVQLSQSEQTIRFRDRDHKRLRKVEAPGSPAFQEVDLFYIPLEKEFRFDRDWRLELLVNRETGPTHKAFVSFELGYRLPEHYLAPLATPVPLEDSQKTPQADPPAGGAPLTQLTGSGFGGRPLWQRIWVQKTGMIVVLSIALGLLTILFFAQTWLVKRPRLTEWTRIGFLLFALIVLGWFANAQLSVVNILTVFNALVGGFSWSYFLMEPMIFILWGSVVAGLVLWGRGAYCGWLCPFGAMQELLNRFARRIQIRQINLPWWLHERLWALKYIIFLVLFGVSLHSLALAEHLAEIEPFKTAVILKFSRQWPYVLFAVAILTAGLFVERFYCRYLCPLGAALAIPGRLRIFEWLKRYRECGNPCRNCFKQCMVGAIHPEGQINPNECLYCLHCQVVYFDKENCYVFIERRLRNERRAERVSQRINARIEQSAGLTDTNSEERIDDQKN